ncbi:MAG: hypothetical protein EOO27_02785 [Comamonadaceae bacterium]|nr:MAG: hypothetical protein EOO27_02785 [Comamonadaceae bacterium]
MLRESYSDDDGSDSVPVDVAGRYLCWEAGRSGERCSSLGVPIDAEDGEPPAERDRRSRADGTEAEHDDHR